MVHRPHLLRLYGYRGLGLLDNVCRQTAVALYFYTLIAVHPQRLLDNSESVRCADMAWRVEQRTCLRNLPPVSAITLIYVHLEVNCFEQDIRRKRRLADRGRL